MNVSQEEYLKTLRLKVYVHLYCFALIMHTQYHMYTPTRRNNKSWVWDVKKCLMLMVQHFLVRGWGNCWWNWKFLWARERKLWFYIILSFYVQHFSLVAIIDSFSLLFAIIFTSHWKVYFFFAVQTFFIH
jgi:hypothetical protein